MSPEAQDRVRERVEMDLWRSERPTEEGWYWVLPPGTDEYTIARVYRIQNSALWCQTFAGDVDLIAIHSECRWWPVMHRPEVK